MDYNGVAKCRVFVVINGTLVVRNVPEHVDWANPISDYSISGLVGDCLT